jgi:hypothetical protein
LWEIVGNTLEIIALLPAVTRRLAGTVTLFIWISSSLVMKLSTRFFEDKNTQIRSLESLDVKVMFLRLYNFA